MRFTLLVAIAGTLVASVMGGVIRPSTIEMSPSATMNHNKAVILPLVAREEPNISIAAHPQPSNASVTR